MATTTAHIKGTFEFDIEFDNPRDGRPLIEHLGDETVREAFNAKFAEPTDEVWWKATFED